MAGRQRLAAPVRELPKQDLEGLVREVLASKPGIKGTEFKKALPKPYQALQPAALDCAREMARRGEVHRWTKAKAERFFLHEPFKVLDRAVPDLLRRGAANEADLKRLVEREAPGHSDLLSSWIPTALARGLVFEQARTSPKSKKSYGIQSDPRHMETLLKKALDEVRKALPKLVALGLSSRDALEYLRNRAGLEAYGASESQSARASFMNALRQLADQKATGTLLSVAELRRMTPLDKARFDEVALDLETDHLVVLHHHDHPASLPPNERERLIQDANGNYYVGIALRRPSK